MSVPAFFLRGERPKYLRQPSKFLPVSRPVPRRIPPLRIPEALFAGKKSAYEKQAQNRPIRGYGTGDI
jgi:hypothetical protein